VNQKRKATLADIANEARVSKQTVSRVINNHPDVSLQTRKEIQEIIDRLGYQPNAIARSLSAKRSRTIGVIIARLDQFGPSTILMEIDREGHEAGYRVIPYIVHEDDMSNADLHLRNLMTLQPDGIVWALTKEEASPEFLEQQSLLHDVPIVTTNMDILDVPSVLVIDEIEASKGIVQHLLEQEYRHIGIITGPLNWRISHKRLEGWRTALLEAGFSVQEQQIAEGNWTAISGQRGMIQLFDQYPEIDAVFASNDQMALGALSAVQARGIRIPEEFGVVGCDDIPEASFFMPSLTTLHQPFAEYGRIIIQSLLQMIEQAHKGETVIQPETRLIRPSLVVRGSSSRK
jgi:DNA-binding LacI/PurR family transcriptional regulator